MKPYPHQIEIASKAYPILQENMMVYLAMEERTGKSLTAILIAEQSECSNVLIITKKKALEGWRETLLKYRPDASTTFSLINYHGIHKAYKTEKSKKQLYKLTINPEDYDLIILDESHNYLSTYPKTGVIWKSVKKLCKEKPIIFLSATPNAQGYQLLYHQLALSSWSPFSQFKNFYRWFEAYGISKKVNTAYGLQETYSKCKPSVWDKVKHLFITKTRAELDFEQEPEDIVHYFELSEGTRDLYNHALEYEVLEFLDPSNPRPGNSIISPLDSSMKLRTTLHMLEGGVAKVDAEYFVLSNTEKVEQILGMFGDSYDNVIMYHYKAELTKLQRYFKKTKLLQGTSFAEGVDLSGYENLIIYSQDFSTARHAQRRSRQANKNRKTPIKVHFFLVRKAISEQVYKTVSVNKKNFIDKVFDREKI